MLVDLIGGREIISDSRESIIAAARVRRRLQQSDLADRMRALGWKWVRQTVGEVENSNRRLTAEEIFGLAIALEVTIPQLMAPSDPDGIVEFPNGQAIHSSSFERLAGRGVNDHAVQWPDGGNSPVFLRYTARPTHDPFDRDFFGPAMAAQGWPQEPEPVAGEQLMQSVVAAIVTSELGVLVGRRNDGKPPWGFISGEIEPGESPADAAIREVKEETGLRVRAGDVIGDRVHPATKRTMVYMAALPTHGTDAFVGDSDELAEVKWASLAEVGELLPGMYEPVREYLEREIGGAER